MSKRSQSQASRRQILESLRSAPRPFAEAEAPAAYRPVVPRTATGPAGLVTRFVEEAEKLACKVYRAQDDAEALATVLSLLQGDSSISCWQVQAIPLPGLEQALAAASISRANPADEHVRVGLSGAEAALAATGSLVLSSGPGRYRATSLLPPVHIVVLREEQIVPDLESWLVSQREDSFEAMCRASNIVVVSGPSRTADIAMELVMGMHGPRELHIVLPP